MAEQKKYKLHVTKDYKLFTHSLDNRPVNPEKRKKLQDSMQSYGFIAAYPVHCVRESGRLSIRDGQHRFAVAQKLGLPIFYVVCEEMVSIPQINNTQKAWGLADYAGSFAAQGKTDYTEVIAFAERHNMPLSMAMAILTNTGTAANPSRKFKDGSFRIKSRPLAERVAKLYSGIGEVNSTIKTRFLLSALFAVAVLPDVDDSRLLAGARRYPEALKRYGTRDGYLDMLEQIYNYGRHTKTSIRIAAENAMRDRNPTNGNGQ